MRRHQQGVALITALLVVAIAVVLASSLVSELNLDIRRTENMIYHDQAYLYDTTTEYLASNILRDDRKQNNYDAFNDSWAGTAPPIPVEGGEIMGTLMDLQGRFNLNNLSPQINGSGYLAALAQFKRLLTALQLPPDMADAVVDWLDTDVQTRPPDGAEDDYYIGLTPPYRAANTLMISPEELRMVKGFNKDGVFEKLAPFITALPVATSININTASAEVLESLSADITRADAQTILARTQGSDTSSIDPFTSTTDFKNYMQSTLNKKNFSIDGMTTASEFFLLKSVTKIQNLQLPLFSILQRDQTGAAHAILRSQGVW